MDKFFLWVFLLFLALAASVVATNQPAMQIASKPAGAASANASLAQLLLDKEKSLPEAEKRKDLDFFKNITTDDFLEVAPDAKVYSKEEMLEGLNVVELQNYSIYDARVLPLNDNAAIVTYDAIVQMTIGDEHAPRYQHVSSVWVNQGGKWLLKFQQATAAQ
ncbi:MAG: DUF4440 domain-containing protein [Chlamydiota bacterium]